MTPKREARKRDGHRIAVRDNVGIDPVPCAVSGKVQYRSRADATKRMPAAGKPLDVYRCDFCHSYHLTSRRECERPPLALRRYPGRAVAE